MENQYGDYYTDPEDNPLADDYEIKRIEFENKIGRLQRNSHRNKEKYYEELFEQERREAEMQKKIEKEREESEFTMYEELYEEVKKEIDYQEKIFKEHQNINKIQEIIEEKNIENLIHYTSYKNLKSILSHGLLSVDELKDKNIDYLYTDKNRYDNFTDGICLSITFHNYISFCAKRYEFDREWIVLVLDKNILWEKDCLFIEGNASDFSNINIQKKNNLNIPENLLKLFDNEIIYKNSLVKRDVENISPNMTTNPQSEVIVFNPIEKKYIKEIHYNNFELEKSYIKNNPSIDFIKSRKYFKYRPDYKLWMNNNG